jgi:hypothetical protein
MPRKLSSIAPDWWDYTTLDDSILRDAAKLSVKDVEQLSRPGFRVVFYDTLEDFYLAEALEYINAWRVATPDNPTGICGPIGPTEQLPLVARLVNELGTNGSRMRSPFQRSIRFLSSAPTANFVLTEFAPICGCLNRTCIFRIRTILNTAVRGRMCVAL